MSAWQPATQVKKVQTTWLSVVAEWQSLSWKQKSPRVSAGPATQDGASELVSQNGSSQVQSASLQQPDAQVKSRSHTTPVPLSPKLQSVSLKQNSPTVSLGPATQAGGDRFWSQKGRSPVQAMSSGQPRPPLPPPLLVAPPVVPPPLEPPPLPLPVEPVA